MNAAGGEYGLRARLVQLVRDSLGEDISAGELQMSAVSRQFGRRTFAVSVPGRAQEWILKTTFRYREALPHLVVPYAAPEMAAQTVAYTEFPDLGEYWVLMEKLDGRRVGAEIAGLEEVVRALARMHRKLEGFWEATPSRLAELASIEPERAEMVHSAVHQTHPFNEATADEWTGKVLVASDDIERCVWSNMVWIEAAATNLSFDALTEPLARVCAQAGEQFSKQADGLASQPDTLLHGDPQGDNWIVRPDGSVATFDYLLCVGPAHVDLSSLIFPTWWTSVSDGAIKLSQSPVEGVLKKAYWQERRSLDASYPDWRDFDRIQALSDVLVLFLRAGMYCRRTLLMLNYGRFDPHSSILEWMGKASACAQALAAFSEALPRSAAIA